jgi:DeoR family transcriptional regulator, aga operon transcriptional repressor
MIFGGSGSRRDASVPQPSRPLSGAGSALDGVAQGAPSEEQPVLKHESESVTAAVRRQRMLAMITARDFVRVAELSEAFGVSDVTVRADLDSLDEAQTIRRVRGGAVSRTRQVQPEPSFEESLASSAMEKQRIGERAASLVTSGASVILDVGTTTTAIARALAARTDLDQVVIVTNGLNIALELEIAIPRFTVLVTGGTLRRLQHSLVDPMASILLERIHADLAFVGCNGIDVERGVTNVNLPEAEIKTRMIASATRAIVVADSSKLGQVHLGHVAPLAEVDTLITGAGANDPQVALFRRAGLEVVSVEE